MKSLLRKRSIIILCAVLGICFLGWPGFVDRDEKAADDCFRKGLAAFDEADWNGCVIYLSDAIPRLRMIIRKHLERAELDPNPDSVRFARQMERAKYELEEGLCCEKKLHKALYTRGRAYYNSGKYGEAIADFSAVIKDYEDRADIELYKARAAALRAQGDINSALADEAIVSVMREKGQR